MNIEEAREYCLSIKGAEECTPFDDITLVYKVMGKMYACLSLEPMPDGFTIILKCEPERSVELRENYMGIIPGYHFNKKHWNSVYLEKDVPKDLIRELINHSVEEVIKKLPKKLQVEYANM